MSVSLIQALCLSVATFLFIRTLTRNSGFKNIPGPPSVSWWSGNFYQIFNREGWGFHDKIVKKYGSVVKLTMLFGSKELYVSDPLALHHIVVKDQYIYEETSTFIKSNAIVFGVSLLSTLGDHHRKQRKMLNPVFSLKHMRDLLPVFIPIAYEFRDVLKRQIGNGPTEINIMRWMSRAALEYIGQGGLGYSFGPLDDAQSNEYSEVAKELGPLFFKTNLLRQFLPYVADIGSPQFRRKVVEWIPLEIVKAPLRIIDKLDSVSQMIFYEKKTAVETGDSSLQSKAGKGMDIMSVLLRANMEADESDRLPEKELLGQMNTFIQAGQDTTTHAVCRILHQLVLNPDVQTKLREEIITARKERNGSDFDYDTLMGLPYLDAVCRETLRVFPILPFLSRTTRKDIVMPLAFPITATDGKTEIKEVFIEKDTNVIISIIGANRSKKIWGEDAEEWKPERWLKPLPESVTKAHLPGVYASMMTFLGGGRACIGFKFAEMEMKIILTVLMESFILEEGPKIFWAMAGLARPNVEGSDESQLPIRMRLLQK